MGNVKYNEVDAAVAELAGGTEFTQGYLPSRHLPGPHDVTTPKVGDKVFKVGRTTGLTRGTITAVGIVVGPIPYAAGHCWFHHQFEVVGNRGGVFRPRRFGLGNPQHDRRSNRLALCGQRHADLCLPDSSGTDRIELLPDVTD